MRKLSTSLLLVFGLGSALWAQSGSKPGLVPDNYLPLSYEIPKGFAEGTHYLPGTLVFKLKEAAENEWTGSTALAQYLQYIGAQTIRLFPQARKPERKTDGYGRAYADLTRIYEITYSAQLPVKEVMGQLKRLGVMEYVQPKLIIKPFSEDKIQFTPNDPSLGSQWHINKINAPLAWDITTGNPAVVVAITDGGTNFAHPDLLNVAYNTADPIDGIDNDADGWVDNYRGWNTGDNNNNPQYNVNHGVAVTGLSSATTNNNVQVAGVGYQCKYLPVRISNSGGSYVGSEPGIFYAAEKGAQIINCSWGGTSPWPLLEDVTRYAAINKGCLVVGSAGNSNNTAPFWPAAYEWVTGVAGSNSADIKSSTSSYYDFVDITAPGESIFTTSVATSANVGTGTSFAAPIVSGAAALVKSVHPAYTPEQIDALLKETSFNLYTLPGNAAYTGKLGRGRLDIGAALTTTPGPSVKMVTRNWNDGNDNLFSPGENVSLTGNFANWLNPSSAALRCTLSTTNPNVTLIDSIVTIGVLNNLAIFNNAGAPFTIHISAACPVNTDILFKLKFQDGSYVDKQFFSLTVNPSFINVTENRVHTSIGSIGRIGYMDENSLYGLGLSKNGNLQHLVVSSFMFANSATKVSDAGIGPTVNPFSTDFLPVSPAAPINPPVVSDFDAQGSFNDNNAGVNKLDVLTRYKVWAWDDPGYENFVILEYTLKNTGAAPLANLFSGIYSFWQMPNAQFYYNQFMANWDATRKLGYGHNAQNPVGSYAGVKLLSYDAVSWYAFNNNGAGGSINLYDGFSEAEKYNAMSNGVSRPTSVAGTISGILGTGPLAIPVGDSVKVAFALVLGDNLVQLQTAADSAQAKYDKLHATWTGTSSSDWNTPTNWFPNQVPNSCATDVTIPLVANQPAITGADFTVGNLTAESGVNISIQNGNMLNVCKNIAADTGTGTTVSGGRLLMMGNTSQRIAGNLHSTFLQLNNAAGADLVATASLSIDSGLELRNGLLSSNGSLTLLSTVAGTAYVDDFSTGFSGTVSGNIHVQRYNPVGLAGFRQLGTPVQLPNISALNGFTPSGTAGFIVPLPTCDPNFVDAASPYGNWMQLVENGSVQYGCSQSLFQVLTSGGMTNGRGYYVEVPGSSTLTFTGAANTGAVSFGLTHANGPVTNGWNQVSNPYPSPLRWELGNVPAGVDAIGKLWVTSGAYMGTFQDLDPNMGGVQSVAIGQAFQVRVSTTGASVPFAVDNSDRTIAPPSYLFAGGDSLTLNIDVLSGGFADLTKIRFIPTATDGLDALYDSPKMMGNANQPMVYSVWNGKTYSTNSLVNPLQPYTVALGVKAALAGNHVFAFSNTETFPASAFIYLEDTQTNTWQDVRITDTYSANVSAGADESRFRVHFYPPMTVLATAGTCTQKGQLDLAELSPATWAYVLLNAQSSAVSQGPFDGTLHVDNLDLGTYTLQLTEQSSGYTLTETVTITGTEPISILANASTLQAEVGQDIQFTANAPQADTYHWDFGDLNTSTDENPAHIYNAAGNYTVVLTASNTQCQTVSQLAVTVSSGSAGIAEETDNTGIRLWYADGNIYLQTTEPMEEIGALSLFDAAGKRVLLQTVAPTQGLFTIDVNHLAVGVYTAQWQGVSVSFRRKIVKGK